LTKHVSKETGNECGTDTNQQFVDSVRFPHVGENCVKDSSKDILALHTLFQVVLSCTNDRTTEITLVGMAGARLLMIRMAETDCCS
jgi:hypothetical protein